MAAQRPIVTAFRAGFAGWAVACGAVAAVGACAHNDDPINVAWIPEEPDADEALDAAHSGKDANDVPPATCRTCSADLHQVLDCDGNVVTTCSADRACLPSVGACVPACDAVEESKSSIGCEFYVASSPNVVQITAILVNVCSSPATLSVELEGVPYAVDAFTRIVSGTGRDMTYEPTSNGVLPPGAVALVFLAGAPDLPALADVHPPVSRLRVQNTGKGAAFRLKTDAPVAAYDIMPYGRTGTPVASATLLLPTSAWGSAYIAVDSYEKNPFVSDLPLVQIVAKEDRTSVTIVPSSDVRSSSDVETPDQGEAMTYTLQRGELLQLASEQGLSGSVIEASKPVGVWAAQGCMAIEPTHAGCDDAHQQIPPASAMGREYVAVRYRDRIAGIEESPPWRVLGLANGTTLTYDPAPPAGAPTTLNAGELVKFYASEPFVIRSQDDEHPFYLAAHMTGCGAVDPGRLHGCPGDPEHVNVVPSSQFLSSYVFFTDPNHPDTNLVVVRQRAEDHTFKDVILECVGPLTGWQAVGLDGRYEYTRVEVAGGSFEPRGACNNGMHAMRSVAPFGVTVWGWGSDGTTPKTGASSYAFPAGARVRPINGVVLDPPAK